MRANSFGLAFCAALILSGCASTADYSESVSRLDSAINDAATSINAIDADITARQNARMKSRILAKNLSLTTADNECAAAQVSAGAPQAAKPNCTLTVRMKTADGKTAYFSDYPLKTSMPKGLKALELVKTYAGRLKAIIEADTAAKVSASANATLGSIETIANELAKDNPNSNVAKKFTAFKEPARGLFDWAVSRYVEHVKVEALAKATNEADPVIQELTTFYATAARAQQEAQFSELHKAFVARQEEFDESPKTPASIDAYVSAAAEYDVALQAQAASPLEAFAAAHQKLTKQLNEKDGPTSLADVAAAIARLEQEAKTIKGLLNAFDTQ